jgi:hypothetical protein
MTRLLLQGLMLKIALKVSWLLLPIWHELDVGGRNCSSRRSRSAVYAGTRFEVNAFLNALPTCAMIAGKLAITLSK